MSVQVYQRKFERDGFTIIVSHMSDDHADTSSLEQDYADCPADERALYQAQDAARLKALYAGDWEYIGVCADVRKQTASNWADGGPVVGRASIWGVESDSDAEYITELETEMVIEALAEVDRLKEALAV